MNIARVKRAVWIAVMASLAMGTLWAPAFLEPHHSGWGDWQWFHHMWESGRVSILRWHEVPLWNPYHCGGASLWGNPQAQVYAPTYLIFALPFGTTLGHKLFMLFHAIVGWAGSYHFARRHLSLSALAATFAATLWCASGFFAWHGAGGHATYLAFYYGPWLLHAWRMAARDLRWTALVAFWMVLVVLEGGHYPFPFFVVLLGFDALVRMFDYQAPGRIVLAGGLSALLTAVLGAFRFVPILITVRDFPHTVIDGDFLTVREILLMLTARSFDFHWPGHRWVWPEYGSFVGWIALGACAIGLGLAVAQLRGARARLPRSGIAALVLGLLFFFLLTQGNRAPIYPWPLLQRLPVYKSIHVPSRWAVMLLFYIAALAGYGIDALGEWLARARLPRQVASLAWGLPWVLVVASIVEMYTVNVGIIDRWDGPEIGHEPAPRFYLVRGRNYFAEYAQYPSENVGTNECYDPVPWEVSPALWLGEGAQARIDPPAAGEVVGWGRTGLTLWADVRLHAPATVIFNQNFARDWSSDAGQVAADHGRLAVRVRGPVNRRVMARYFPADVPYSVAISVLGAIACIFVATRRPRMLSHPAPTRNRA